MIPEERKIIEATKEWNSGLGIFGKGVEEMTPEQLKQIIAIANKGGWTYFRIEKDDYIIQCVGENFYQIYYKKEQAKYRSFHINEIIFDPEFGKAYWGKEVICGQCETIMIEFNTDDSGPDIICPKCNHRQGIADEKFHQSKLGGMSESERKAYMVNDLSHRLNR